MAVAAVRRGLTAGLAAAALLVGVASCGPAGNDGRNTDEGDQVSATNGPVAAERHGTGELRTDPEPLIDRFPVLDSPREVRWMSGTYGDPDNPGPSTYWIDAVITLEPAQVDALTAAYAPEPGSETPVVVDGMRDHLPPGPFWTGAALDAGFKEERWWASAFLDPEAGQLVLVATGT